MSAWTMGGIVGLGVGAAGAGLGTVFAVRAASKRSDADAICNLPNGGCPTNRAPEVDALDADAESADQTAAAGFVVGGIGVAAGVTMLIVGSMQDSSPKSGWVTPYVGPYSAGIVGRF